MINNFFEDKLNISISCASGVERALKSELNRLGFTDVPIVNGMASVIGYAKDVARLNINLKTADRVYIKLANYTAQDFDTLFDGAKQVDWKRIIPKNAQIVVTGKSVKSKLFALSSCQSIIKKAIVDKLSSFYNIKTLPECGAKYNIVFNIFKDEVELFLNTSGAGLHKRGYRDLVGIAPIKETLASCLLLYSDFYKDRPFLDPFCGSGTIAIEATKIALNIAPGILRKFDFNSFDNFDNRIFQSEIERARDLEKKDAKLEFFASDIDPKAIKLATYHAKKAGVDKYISFKNCDIKDVKLPKDFGTIVSNPPYGERVYDKIEAENCYKHLGNLVRNSNWSAFIITACKSFERHFKKKADRIKKMYNSNLECNYYYYYGKKIEKGD